jgi:hypothetical protein
MYESSEKPISLVALLEAFIGRNVAAIIFVMKAGEFKRADGAVQALLKNNIGVLYLAWRHQ